MEAISLCGKTLLTGPLNPLPLGDISAVTVPTTVDLGQEGSWIPFNAPNQAQVPALSLALPDPDATELEARLLTTRGEQKGNKQRSDCH